MSQGRSRRRSSCSFVHGTSDEYPLTSEEISILSRIFRGHVRVLPSRFAFFRVFAHHTWGNPVSLRTMTWLDELVIRILPFLWKYSFWQWISLQKPESAEQESIVSSSANRAHTVPLRGTSAEGHL